MTNKSAADAGDGGAPDLRLVAGGNGAGKLTAKQQGFVQAILKGANQSDAYREAYNAENMSASTVWNEASKLFAHPTVAARIRAGQRRQEEVAVHSGAALRLHVERELFSMTTNADSDQARLRALELLGKLEKVGAFSERVEQVTNDLTPEELKSKIESKLRTFFEKTA
jgi:phage terminase small subunit